MSTSKNHGKTHLAEQLLLYDLTRAHGSVMLITKRGDSSPGVSLCLSQSKRRQHKAALVRPRVCL